MKQCSPLMAQMMRGSTNRACSPIFGGSAAMATRGGGGSWHRPDPKPYPLYTYTRRYRLEDINTILYGDFAPEFHMHLHSMWVQSSKQGLALWVAYFFLIIFPMWCFARKMMKNTTALLFPSVRSGEQHAHMAPALWHHMKTFDSEKAQDKFGRLNATFYRNWCRQENSRKTSIHNQMEKHF